MRWAKRGSPITTGGRVDRVVWTDAWWRHAGVAVLVCDTCGLCAAGGEGDVGAERSSRALL